MSGSKLNISDLEIIVKIIEISIFDKKLFTDGLISIDKLSTTENDINWPTNII